MEETWGSLVGEHFSKHLVERLHSNIVLEKRLERRVHPLVKYMRRVTLPLVHRTGVEREEDFAAEDEEENDVRNVDYRESDIRQVPYRKQESDKLIEQSTLDMGQMEKQRWGGLAEPVSKKTLYKRRKEAREKDTSSGDSWFNLKSHELTESRKRDIELIRMRNHFAGPGKYFKNLHNFNPKFFQMGRIAADPFDYHGRAKGKERKRTIVQSVMNDEDFQERKRRKLDILSGKQKDELEAIRKKKPNPAKIKRVI